MNRRAYSKAKKFIGTGLLMFLVVQSLLAQPQSLLKRDLTFDQLPDKFELSQRAINCILQDKEGFLWIGTWSGLIRYDGYTSLLYKSEPEKDRLKSDLITSLYEDKNGYLWVGTLMEGVFKFDKKNNSFKQYKHDPNVGQSLSSNRVHCIYEDGAGELWVGTEHGLNHLEESSDSFTVFQANPKDSSSLSNSRIRALYLSSKNEFWVATEDGINLVRSQSDGHCSFKKIRYTADRPNIEHHNYITQIGEIVQNNKSILWLASPRGLKKLEDGVITNYMVNEQMLNSSHILSMATVTGTHPFIITGSESGISFFDVTKRKFVRTASVLDEQTNLSHNSATTLFIDNGGILWVGTKRGLNKFDSYSNNFQSYKITSFDKTKSVITGVEAATGGGYWVSTMGGGLFKVNGQHIQKVHLKNLRKNKSIEFIQTIRVDRIGNVWLGTAGDGVGRFREKDLNSVDGTITQSEWFDPSTTVLSADYISAMAEDNAGTMWVGTWHQGLNRILPNGTVQFFNDTTLFDKPLTTIHVDQRNTVWIGTQGAGLYKINAVGNALKIRRYHRDDSDKGGLPDNFIGAVFEDHAGLLWIGTNIGLYALNPRTEIFKRFHWNNDVNTIGIVGIQEDRNGRLWLAHADGITLINPNDTTFSKKFDYADHIEGGFYYNNIASRNGNSELLFGGTEGFNIITPDSLRENKYVPKVNITDIQVFGKSVMAQLPLVEGAPGHNEIRFSYDKNSIAFSFAMPEYASPEKTRYAYKLDGFDENWRTTDPGKHDAIYTNLNPGNYTFNVKAFNNDNVWSKDITQLKLVIDPPWWKSIWARGCYAILAILALVLFRRAILWRAELRHEINLNQQEAARLLELDAAKTKFFTNVSHEFRTPITLILSPLERLQSKTKEPESQKELSLIERNARRLLNLVNQLLDFRKLEVDEIKFAPTEGDIIKFIKETFDVFADLSEKKGINLTFRSDIEYLKILFDKDKIEKTLFNLLSNALKFTPAKGHVSLEVSADLQPDGRFLVIKVIDTGIGISEDIKDKIFERFFQGDIPNTMLNQGSGIGLSLTREFVKTHNGTIVVESKPGAGSTFVVKLPIPGEEYTNQPLEPQELLSQLQHDLPHLESLSDKSEAERPLLLLVEDNDDFRRYLKDNLKSEYAIIEAQDGEEGWNKCLVEQPNLVVSDIMMPRMNGLELCNRIKNNAAVSHIPVILLTARTEEEQKLEGLTQGADDYITKPFNFGVLKFRIQYLISLRKQFHHALNNQIPVKASELKITSLDEKFIKEAIAVVEENISDTSFSIGELSKRMLISRTTLFKKILSLTGKSPLDFIKTIRLQHAAQLLERSQLMVSEVAYKVGFNDPKYFARQFKQAYGLLPSEYAMQKKRSEKSPVQALENLQRPSDTSTE